MGSVRCDLGVAAVVTNESQVLLVKESAGRYSGHWGLPKGYVDEDELPFGKYKGLTIKLEGEEIGLGYKGIVKMNDDNNPISNQLRLSSVPKGEEPIAIFTYNKDGYTQHCKDFKEYQVWLKERNEARYVETKTHGQQIDGKNMAHCMRLINMASEIADGKGVIVRRPDAEYLLSIRRGELSLEELIELADEKINNMDELFDNSNLPDKVEYDLVHKLLVTIRTEFYHQTKVNNVIK